MSEPVQRAEFERLSDSVDGLRSDIRTMSENISGDVRQILTKVNEIELNNAVNMSSRASSCPFKESINELKKSHEYDKTRKSIYDRNLRNTQLSMAIAVALIALITFISKYA